MYVNAFLRIRSYAFETVVLLKYCFTALALVESSCTLLALNGEAGAVNLG